MTEQKLDQIPTKSPQDSPKYLWHAGELVEWDNAMVHVSLLGWTAVSSVFEGIQVYWEEQRKELYIFQLEAHLKRLFRSMKIMRMTSPYSEEELSQAIAALLRANEYRCDAYVRPLAYFSGGIPGYLAVLDQPGVVVITTRPAPSTLATPKVAHCNISSWSRISDNVMPPRAKESPTTRTAAMCPPSPA